MRRIASKIVNSEVKTRFIEVCDGCGKTLVDEDVNPDKYKYYRLTGGEISCDKDQDIRYKVENHCTLDICEDCMKVIDHVVAETLKSLKNKEVQNNG